MNIIIILRSSSDWVKLILSEVQALSSQQISPVIILIP